MRYFLDFDRTLFDTDLFKTYLRTREDLADTSEYSDEAFVSELLKRAHAGSLTFEPGELSRFLYQDAAQFLREKENAVTIITFGGALFQELKTKSALYGIPRMSVVYTGDVMKGEFLAPHTHLHAGAILVDDSPRELETLALRCPGFELYEIRRDGGVGDGRWSVIRSLSELP